MATRRLPLSSAAFCCLLVSSLVVEVIDGLNSRPSSHNQILRVLQAEPGATTVNSYVGNRSLRRRRYSASRILYTPKGICSFNPVKTLLACGDVSPNPGPRRKKTVKYPCGDCRSKVTNKQDAILCAHCDKWFHVKCLQLSRTSWQYYLAHPDIDWECHRCALPNFSDSFFLSDDPDQLTDCTDQPCDDSLEWYSKTVTSYYKSNVKIAYLNINSILNKIDEVREMLNRNMFDVLFIAETKVDNTVSDAFLMCPGFRLTRRDRKKGAGGLLAYIRAGMKTYRRHKLEPRHIESICLDVEDSNNSRFLVCACYRSPGKCKESVFIDCLSTSIETMFRTRKDLLLLGDFNMDMMERSECGNEPNKNLSEFCQRYCLENQILQPTRITKTTKTLIDVILTSHKERYSTTGTLHLGVSDHDLIYTIRKCKLPRPKPRFTEYRSMKHFDDASFLADLEYIPWDTAFIFDDIDDIWAHWSSLYKDILDKHAPVKKKQIRGDQLPWITPEIQRQISHRNKLYKLHRLNPTPQSWNTYKIQRNKVTSLKRKEMKLFCHAASTKTKHAGEFWKRMRPLLPTSRCSNSKNICLVDGERISTHPSPVAASFNSYFCKMASSSGDGYGIDEFMDHPSVKKIAERSDPNGLPFSFKPVYPDYIHDILIHLNPNKAIGVDNISPRLLRHSAPVIADEITKLINLFLLREKWPSEWKRSNVTPVLKKGDDTDITNYRPVSVLTTLSKVYEKVMYDQIYESLSTRLSSNLSGFMKGHSCCTALMKMTEDWRTSLDNKETVVAVAVDLSKAFDSICHDLLLAKLKAYGLSNSASNLMEAYLRDRYQRVKVQGAVSDWCLVSAGVPQGSLLGPLLFNFFINDLNYFVPDVSLRLYADDTTGYTSDTSPCVLEFLMNDNLQSISTWFGNNFLQINQAKTQAIVIGPSQYKYDLKLNGSPIQITETLKILGVTMDPRLTYKGHISEQLQKAYAKTAALRRIRRFLPQTTMKGLYKAFILPHLEYCSPLLIGLGKTQAKRLEDANYYILRTLFGAAKSVSYEFLLNLVKLRSLEQRRYYQSLVLLFKCINEYGPQYISELFNFKITKYNLRGSGLKLVQPSFNLEWRHKSFAYLASRLWNNLPVAARDSPNLEHFRRSLSKINLDVGTVCSCPLCF